MHIYPKRGAVLDSIMPT